LELYDQTVRERSGGEMRTYLSRQVIPNESFVYERIGEEGRAIVRSFRPAEPTADKSAASARDLRSRLTGLCYRVALMWRMANDRLARLLLGAEGYVALRVGQFRRAGEVHQWMYDRFSLARLMLAAGLVEPQEQTAITSRVADWASFNLDTTTDGTVVKP